MMFCEGCDVANGDECPPFPPPGPSPSRTTSQPIIAKASRSVSLSALREVRESAHQRSGGQRSTNQRLLGDRSLERVGQQLTCLLFLSHLTRNGILKLVQFKFFKFNCSLQLVPNNLN